MIYSLSNTILAEIQQGNYENFKQILTDGDYHGIEIRGSQKDSIDFEKIIQLLLAKINHIDFRNNHIDNAGATKIANALYHNKNITHLELGENKINDNGVKNIASVLASTNIDYLGLGFNQIGDKGAIAIAEVLPRTKITELNFFHAGMGDIGMTALAKSLPTTQLIYLRLDENNITDESAIIIAQVLSQSKLTHLDLENNSIGPRGINAIAQALPQSQITHLNLAANINNYFDDNHFDESVDFIVPIDGNNDIATIIAHVVPNTKLRELNLSSSSLGDKGAIKIVQALPKTMVISLDFSTFNNISNAGAQILSQCLAGTSVIEFNIKTNNVDDEALISSIKKIVLSNGIRYLIEKGTIFAKLNIDKLECYLPLNIVDKTAEDMIKAQNEFPISLYHSNKLYPRAFNHGYFLQYSLVQGSALAQALNTSKLRFLPPEIIDYISTFVTPIQAHQQSFMRGYEHYRITSSPGALPEPLNVNNNTTLVPQYQQSRKRKLTEVQSLTQGMQNFLKGETLPLKRARKK